MNKGWVGLPLEKVAIKVRAFVNRWVTYVSDKPMIGYDDWRSASYTFRAKKGDCDNKAILFQTIMEILGFKNQCVCYADGVSDMNGNEFGHLYNLIFMNDVWVVVDPTISLDEFTKTVYGLGPDKFPGLQFLFNSKGTYKFTGDN